MAIKISSSTEVTQFLCELKSILNNEKNYNNTVIDDKDPLLPYFYSFISEIESKDVYIKVKIRDKTKNKVFCVSFHFARYPTKHPLLYENN